MTFKKVIGKIHLWLGFTCGMVVFVSFFAAAVFVWERELTDWYYHDEIFAEHAGDSVLPMSVLYQEAQKAIPGKVISGMSAINEADRCVIFYAYKEEANPGWFCWDTEEYYDFIYVDPYTAKASVVDQRYDWIGLTMRLHIQLLLRYEIGHWIVGFSTLFMFIMMITGIVLWWPKSKAALKQRFTINWKAKWRRVNYDIHNVGGFYTWIIVFIIATTGLVWTFEWWHNGLYTLYGGDPHHTHEEPPKLRQVRTSDAAMDKIFLDLRERRPSWTSIYLSTPHYTDTLTEYHYAYLSFNTHSAFVESDSYQFRPDNGELVQKEVHEQKDFADKLMGSNYDIHVGSIYGLPTKILASFAALFCAFLPVTGFMIWWGRRNKTTEVKAQKSREARAPRPVVVIKKPAPQPAPASVANEVEQEQKC